MAMTASDYLSQLQALLPPGGAWTREADADLTQLLLALAEELARIEARGEALIQQSDPRTADEMLTDWERAMALPEPCTGPLSTIQERRSAVLGKLTGRGGASRRYFIELASALGFSITITEYRPFRAGSRAGEPLANLPGWRHIWQVNSASATYRHFHAGSAAGEPVRTWGNALLECAIGTRAPAHTTVWFSYHLEEQNA